MKKILILFFVFLLCNEFSKGNPREVAEHASALPVLSLNMPSFFNFFTHTKQTDKFEEWENKINEKLKQEKYSEAYLLSKEMEKAALVAHNDYWVAVSYYYSGFCKKQEENYTAALSYFLRIINKNITSIADDNERMFQLYKNTASTYKSINVYPEAIQFCHKCIQLENKIKNKTNLISIYAGLGIMYSSQHNYTNAKECYLKCITLLKESDARLSSLVFNNLGNDEYAQGNYAEAIKYYIQSIQLCEKNNNNQGLALAYNNLGNIYSDGLKDFNKAQAYYTKSLEIEQKVGNNEGVAYELNSIGYVYNIQNKYGEAEKAHLEALAIFKTLKNIEGIAKALENLGAIYRKQGNYTKAILTFTECIVYRKKNKDEKKLASLYNNIGALYLDKKEYIKALSYFAQGIDLAQKVNDKALTKLLYAGINETYAKLGQYNKAYAYAIKYSTLNDTLLNATITQQVIDIQEKYEKTKMQQQIALQNLDIKNKALQRNGILAFLILSLLVFSGVVYFVLQKRKNEKLLYARNATIKEQEIKNLVQNSEIRAMASLAEGQDNERQRISRDLHDRVGSLLSLVKYNLSASEEAESTIIKENLALLDQTYQEVRSISHNLHSGLLRNFGLKVALHDLKKTVEAHNSLRFNLQFHEEEFVLSKEKEEVVFRVLQELVTNALKYAEASFLDIQVNSADEGVVLVTVEDDGKGFDTQTLKKGIGLSNIHYRLSTIGGSMEINSSPGSGAYFVISVPVNEEVNTVLS